MIFDLDNTWMPIECPQCGFSLEITLRDVRLEESCYGHNCCCHDQPVDHNSSAHPGLNNC